MIGKNTTGDCVNDTSLPPSPPRRGESQQILAGALAHCSLFLIGGGAGGGAGGGQGKGRAVGGARILQPRMS